MTKGIIDRFEGQYALVEIGKVVKEINRVLIPAEAREGDVIRQENCRWILDRQATDELKREVQKLADGLWKD